jgi:CubicO group peptidase (beta-lactamase class C family)
MPTGEIFYEKASGYDSKEPDAQPLKQDAIMWIASCTKLLASICALQCVERGQITLDEPVSTYLPELKAPEIVRKDATAPNGFTLTPAKNAVTLRQLLTHTSGVPYEWGAPGLVEWRKVQPPVPDELKGKTSTTFGIPLLFEPGEGWTYGGGLDWAGELAGRLNKMDFGEYMEQHIFKPLGMDSSTFRLADRPDLKARLMRAGKRTPEGKLVPNEGLLFPEKVVDCSGGGGLYSCATDYIKVLADLVKDEPTILKRETVVTMLAAPQITNEKALSGLVMGRVIAAANAAPADAGLNYGLGGSVLTKDSEILPKGTLSWGGLPNLKWFLHPELQVAAFYATQVMPHGDQKNNWLSGEFFKEVIKMHAAQSKTA